MLACECYGALKSSRQPEKWATRAYYIYKESKKKVLDKRNDLWENTFNKREKPTPIEATFSRWMSAKDSTTTANKVVVGTWAQQHENVCLRSRLKNLRVSGEKRGAWSCPERYQLMISSCNVCTQVQGAGAEQAERLTVCGFLQVVRSYCKADYRIYVHY